MSLERFVGFSKKRLLGGPLMALTVAFPSRRLGLAKYDLFGRKKMIVKVVYSTKSNYLGSNVV